MKKLYFLLALSLLSFTSFAVTVTVNATGATGSYKTGYTQAATGRTDGSMVVAAASTATPRRGYAVFNLSGIVPAGATVTAVSVRFNFSTSAGGVGVVCGIYGFAGDLSTVTTAATLYGDCASGTAFNTTNWGSSTTGAQDILPFNAAGTTFIQTNAATTISVCFSTSTGANIYTITGEGGTAATQPQLQITYTCPGITGTVTAAAAPNPLCSGATLTLTGVAAGATSYSWAGPGPYSATLLSPTLITSPASAGVYTLTAYNAAGCSIPATTAAVVVKATPLPITGSAFVCMPGTSLLADATTGGTWASAPVSVATVLSSSGLVHGVAPGTATITYTGATGCGVSVIVSVNPLPPAITGASNICVGNSTLLGGPSGGGTWSSSNTLAANVDPVSGFVTGLSGGTATISYTAAGCSSTFPFSVNTAPMPITGITAACPGATTTLSDAAGGGTWSSGTASVATIGSLTGVVTGVAPGTTIVTFANGCGPAVVATVVVNSLPDGITGLTTICLGASTTLSDASVFGTWSASPSAVATIGSGTGLVTGASLGTATVTYTLPTTCAITTVITINAPPAPIIGSGTVCSGLTTTLTEAATGGIWSSGNTTFATVGATGVVTGVAFGDVAITYTAGAGCFIVHSMTVNPLAPVLGRDSVCLGLTTFLTNIVGGGHWSSSPLGIAAVDIDSGRVTGLVPGFTTITYALPTGCQSSAGFHVIKFPGAINGNTHACPGTSTVLSDTTAHGFWSSANNGIATVGSASGMVTGVNADTLTIKYAVLPGCAVSTIVTINPLPAPITGSSTICPLTIDSLSDISPGGTWTSITPALATVSGTSGVVSTLAQGSAVIAYTLPTGCVRTKTLSVDPLPVPVVTYEWETGTLYSNTSSGYTSYQWYDSIQGMIVGATSPSLAALYNEFYFVVVTDTNGCKGASVVYHFNVTSLAAGNTTVSNGVKIYPNPASGKLYIESQVNVRAVITGIDGKIDLEQGHAREIDVSRLPDAMYLIMLYDDKGNLVSKQKLIKQ